MTKFRFTRAPDQALAAVSEGEQLALMEHFAENGLHVQRPQNVCHGPFCEAVDAVFSSEQPGKGPTSPTPPRDITITLDDLFNQGLEDVTLTSDLQSLMLDLRQGLQPGHGEGQATRRLAEHHLRRHVRPELGGSLSNGLQYITFGTVFNQSME